MMLCICNIYDKSLQFGFFFYKKNILPFGTILFEKCTAKTLVMLYISTRNTNKSETILHTKPFIVFLNGSSGIKRGQPHNTYNIIITDTKQRQHLCFFVSLSNLFGRKSLLFQWSDLNRTDIHLCLTNKTKKKLFEFYFEAICELFSSRYSFVRCR